LGLIVIALPVLVFLEHNLLNAQTTASGSLTGIVTDPSDHVVPGANVELKDNTKGTLQATKTDSPQACAHLELFLRSWHPNERRLLFATSNGTPWDQNLLLKRKFRPLLRSLGIVVPRGNGFHAFRHANATLMNSFGASYKLRQQRLGHAAGSPITDAIYTHVTSEDARRVAAQLGDAVWGISDASGRENENGLEGAASKPFQIN
jgi:integrase